MRYELVGGESYPLLERRLRARPEHARPGSSRYCPSVHHRQVPIPSDRAFDTSSIDQAWAATAAGGEGALPEAPARLCVTGASAHLPSRFPVEDMAVACVGAALLAPPPCGGSTVPPRSDLAVNRADVAAAVRSESLRRADGAAGAGFSPLSRFWRTADG